MFCLFFQTAPWPPIRGKPEMVLHRMRFIHSPISPIFAIILQASKVQNLASHFLTPLSHLPLSHSCFETEQDN